MYPISLREQLLQALHNVPRPVARRFGATLHRSPTVAIERGQTPALIVFPEEEVIEAQKNTVLVRSLSVRVVALTREVGDNAAEADACSMLAAGINLALGTDNVTNNNSYDMFKEMQIVGKLMALHHRTPNALPTRTILHMATLGGARALGLADKIGSLEPGKQADLIALDLDEIGWTPSNGQDVYTALVYAVSGMHVRDVMVAGEWVMRDGRFQTINDQQARHDLETSYQTLSEKLNK